MTGAFSLDRRKALVTGGTSGIGKAIARRFAEDGAEVLIIGRRADGTDIAREIGAAFIRADLGREADIDQLAKAAMESGPVDILVNSAGIENTGPTLDVSSFDEFDRVFAINTRGLYGMLRGARVMMLRGGSVINISSIAARLGAPGYGQYAASKAAVESLTRTAALELAPRDIRVNAIAPGTIETAMVPPDHPERKIIAAFCPLGRPGAPEDVAALAHFLASSESAYITGQVFVVDGGMTAGLGVRALELAIGG